MIIQLFGNMFVDRRSIFLSQTRHICLLIWVRLGAFAYWSESDSAHLLTGQSQTRRICLLIWVRLGVFAFWSESDSAHLLTDLSQTRHICVLIWVRLGAFAYWSESDSTHWYMSWVRLGLVKKMPSFNPNVFPQLNPYGKLGTAYWRYVVIQSCYTLPL